MTHKLPECDRCHFYAQDPHLVCSLHPSGPEGDSCLDFRNNPNYQAEEPWQPVGAAYYNGELVQQLTQQRTEQERLDLLDWHPMFTNRCPDCEMPMHETIPRRVHWDCEACGWKDDTI
jgi:hypothetical protein